MTLKKYRNFLKCKYERRDMMLKDVPERQNQEKRKRFIRSEEKPE